MVAKTGPTTAQCPNGTADLTQFTKFGAGVALSNTDFAVV